MSQKVIETINGIHRAANDIGYDGALTVDGKPLEIGLKREQGHPVYGSRVMDGFNIGISGKTLILSYHTDLKLKEVYNQDLEAEIGSMMRKIIKELKKRFKANEGKTLSLKKKGEVDVRVESTSRVRYWATARCLYEISNLGDTKDVLADDSRPDIEKSFKKFLDQGGLGKRAENAAQRPRKS
tara:strand:+ start:26 stop:574 length:549 start_codon:yes stop_codon:yes gene_type:complete